VHGTIEYDPPTGLDAIEIHAACRFYASSASASCEGR
jgi:hypothetical protein